MTGVSDLARIIASIESSGFQFALRFEPKQYQQIASANKSLLDLISEHNECNEATASVLYCSSWGLYQIMGYNLYEQGLRVSLGQFLSDPQLQLASFNAFLAAKNLPQDWSHLKSNPADLLRFALSYNGTHVYAQSMLKAARVLGL